MRPRPCLLLSLFGVGLEQICLTGELPLAALHLRPPVELLYSNLAAEAGGKGSSQSSSSSSSSSRDWAVRQGGSSSSSRDWAVRQGMHLVLLQLDVHLLGDLGERPAPVLLPVT